jgi:hypothetical protein
VYISAPVLFLNIMDEIEIRRMLDNQIYPQLREINAMLQNTALLPNQKKDFFNKQKTLQERRDQLEKIYQELTIVGRTKGNEQTLRENGMMSVKDNTGLPLYIPNNDLDKDIENAEKIKILPSIIGKAYHAVTSFSHGANDYKQLKPNYQDYGNLRFGAVGSAMGIKPGELQRSGG